MTKKLLFAITILMVAAFAALAADASGKWVAQMPGRNGGPTREITFTFTVDGSNLTGTVGSQNREGEAVSTPITEGKVDGDTISFKTTRTMGENTFTQEYSGTVKGDTLMMKMTMPGRDGGEPRTREFTAKRATT